MPDSDSESRNWIVMTHSGGQTRHLPFSFYAHPCDRRLRQRVERVTFEGQTAGSEDDDDRLVRHGLTLAVGA